RKGSLKDSWSRGTPGIYLGCLGTSLPIVYTYHNKIVRPHAHYKCHYTRFPGMKLDQTPIADLQSADPERLPPYFKSTEWANEIAEIEEYELQGGAELAFQPVTGINSDISLQGGGTLESSDRLPSLSDSLPADRAIDLSKDISSSTCDIPTQLSEIGGDGADMPSSLIDRQLISSDDEEEVPLINKKKKRRLESFANLRTEINQKRKQQKKNDDDENGNEDDGYVLDLQPQLKDIDEKELLADDFDLMLTRDWHPRSRQTMSRGTYQNLVKESTQLEETEEDDLLSLKRLLAKANESMKEMLGDSAKEYNGSIQDMLDLDIEAKVKDVFDVSKYHRNFLKRIKTKAAKTNRSTIRTMLNHPTTRPLIKEVIVQENILKYLNYPLAPAHISQYPTAKINRREIPVPQNYRKAMNSNHSDYWKAAKVALSLKISSKLKLKHVNALRWEAAIPARMPSGKSKVKALSCTTFATPHPAAIHHYLKLAGNPNAILRANSNDSDEVRKMDKLVGKYICSFIARMVKNALFYSSDQYPEDVRLYLIFAEMKRSGSPMARSLAFAESSTLALRMADKDPLKLLSNRRERYDLNPLTVMGQDVNPAQYEFSENRAMLVDTVESTQYGDFMKSLKERLDVADKVLASNWKLYVDAIWTERAAKKAEIGGLQGRRVAVKQRVHQADVA
ncbi:hypothetical protein HDV05_008623, partial [Chytridiales sp. JEL 0842]